VKAILLLLVQQPPSCLKKDGAKSMIRSTIKVIILMSGRLLALVCFDLLFLAKQAAPYLFV
jgi:hypothetical protein